MGGGPCPRTGCPPLSFTAESGGARQSWAAALQEAVTETLSDYEVAEKIWSNRANRHCADCRASRPDWAAVNLGVVICKQCAGEGCRLQPKWGEGGELGLGSDTHATCPPHLNRPAPGPGVRDLQGTEPEAGHKCVE